MKIKRKCEWCGSPWPQNMGYHCTSCGHDITNDPKIAKVDRKLINKRK